jgi:hypothetical protein
LFAVSEWWKIIRKSSDLLDFEGLCPIIIRFSRTLYWIKFTRENRWIDRPWSDSSFPNARFWYQWIAHEIFGEITIVKIIILKWFTVLVIAEDYTRSYQKRVLFVVIFSKLVAPVVWKKSRISQNCKFSYFSRFISLGHRQIICIDSACSVWNSSPPKYEISFVFCSFLCLGLNVLVSFFISIRISLKIDKISLTHPNLDTKMSKIQQKLHILVCQSFIDENYGKIVHVVYIHYLSIIFIYD